MNVAIFTPNQNLYSETFIMAHKHYLKDKVFYYYGGLGRIRLEGKTSLVLKFTDFRLRLWRKLKNYPHSYVNNESILYSLKSLSIDVLLIEYGTHAHNLLPIIKQSGLPTVVHFHGYDASRAQTIEDCSNYKEVFQTASKVISVSRVMEQRLLDLGCPKEKLEYNVYGPQPEFKEVQPQYSKKQFLSIGRFTDKKAPYYTIMAFKKVVEEHPDVHLLMAGDGTLYGSCKNLVRYYGLQQRVHFLGIIKPEHYRTLLAESLAFVQHSITADDGDMEGTPLAVLEASSSGLPVIATNHAGIPDVVIHGKTGLLCEEHDVETMSKNMLTVLEDIPFAKQLGTAGKIRIAELFSLERHINQLQDLLESVTR